MSEKEYNDIDKMLTDALAEAEQQMLHDKASRDEVLVLWNSEKEEIEYVPARELV